MKKYFCGLFFVLVACSHTVKVEESLQYKCGEQIVSAEYLNDNSVILTINGVNTVLNRSASDTGMRFDNSDSQMTFTVQDDNIYLAVKGKNYPLCLRIER